MVAINSMLSNTRSNPSDDTAASTAPNPPLRFNIAVSTGDKSFFEEKIHSGFDAEYGLESAIVRVREFTPPGFLKDYLDRKFDEKKAARRISRHMQSAWLLLKDIFPDVNRVIYFDGDTLMLGDVRLLFAQGAQLTSQCYLAAVPHFFPAILYFSNPFKSWSDLRKFKTAVMPAAKTH